jgi:hypothetical protein
MKKIFVGMCCWLAVAVPGRPAAGDADTAAQTIRIFYKTYADMKTSGLPDPNAMAKLSPYFSAPLQKAIKSAQLTQARCEKLHPGDKPPWVEGDMFSSSFEGFTRFQVNGAGASKGPRTLYKVSFEYAEKGQKPVTWTDEVALIQEGGRWVIDNVFYRMNAAFRNGFGSALREGLSSNSCQ